MFLDLNRIFQWIWWEQRLLCFNLGPDPSSTISNIGPVNKSPFRYFSTQSMVVLLKRFWLVIISLILDPKLDTRMHSLDCAVVFLWIWSFLGQLIVVIGAWCSMVWSSTYFGWVESCDGIFCHFCRPRCLWFEFAESQWSSFEVEGNESINLVTHYAKLVDVLFSSWGLKFLGGKGDGRHTPC